MATVNAAQTATTTSSSPQFRMSSHRCGSCEVTFSSVQEMRAHAKTQLHVENLRRRLVELDPIAHEPEKDYGDFPSADEASADGDDSDASLQSDSEEESPGPSPQSIPPFDPGVCLFCQATQSDSDANLEHMSKAHGLTIPYPEKLLVDPETLLAYLYLVIEGYRECIVCGTVRNNPHAIRRHMLDKSHCRIDPSPPSEYADFYARTDDSNKEGENYQLTKAHAHAHPHLLSDEGTLSLSSGKIVANRSAAPLRPPRVAKGDASSDTATTTTTAGAAGATAAAAAEDGPVSSDVAPRSSGALTKAEKREATLANRMTMLSVSDQRAIAHLTPAEQRATIERRDKEMQRARRADRRMVSRIEALNNKTMMHHYRPAGTERPNG
ncbi:hypothetical protein jhhlp_005744 [Lomentospora prolificans]|uniref:C2H2-type domain-containing protein n=1 Tax=Lomentospora prolificans TaxID=41688 RepID=A0A2N3N403_9PEZI|nr:hypothetical protein jhhlp_005744 [Lomentospora prolificans]